MMKQLFQENRNAFLLLLVLLFVLVITAYFLFYRPLAEDLKQAENQEVTLQSEIDTLQVEANKIAASENNIENEIESIRLESKIPRTAELEEFLLIINEIEAISKSRIDEMYFGYQGALPEREVIQEEEEIMDESENAEEEEAAEEKPVIEMAGIPEGLQPITVALEVTSPDYEYFQLFMKEIEKQERMMVVTNLEFNKPAEMELILEEGDETISATIDVTTFYFEK